MPLCVSWKIAAVAAMFAYCCSRRSAKGAGKTYEEKLEALTASGAASGFASVKKTTTGNRFEYHRVKGAANGSAAGARVDLTAFDGVIGVEAAAGGTVAHVEGMATMETVVAYLEPRGFRLPIVPELKHITVGGAISGVGIESGSFRHGWFHEALVSADVLTPGGAVLTCGPDGEHADVFRALPNSYGTLGYVLRATLKVVPSKPYVAATTTVHGSFAEAAEVMRASAEGHDFVEGLWWAPDRVSVTLSTYVDAPPAGTTPRRFDGLEIYWRAVREPSTIVMTAETYYFRWDPDWFWNIPTDAGGWLIRLLVPRRLRTSSTYKWLRSLAIVKRWHKLETLWKPMGQPFVQDWAVPWSEAVPFVAEATKTKLRPDVPYMLLPVKPADNVATHYPTKKEAWYMNLGTYTEIDVPFAEAMAETKRIDDLCISKHGGIKMLYSSSFVDKATHDAVYGTLDPKTRDKVDPAHTRPSVFEKTAHPSVLGHEDLVLGY